MQTSAKNLTKKQESAIIDQFVTLIADLKTPQECKAFLQAFLTDTEQQVFAKRLAIIWALQEGQSYKEIKKNFHVSSATISTVASQIDNTGLQLGIKKMHIDKWAHTWASKLSQMLPF